MALTYLAQQDPWCDVLSLWRWHCLGSISCRLKDSIPRPPLFGKTIISGNQSHRVGVGLGSTNCLLPRTTSTTLSVTFLLSCTPARSAQGRIQREGLVRIRTETTRIIPELIFAQEKTFEALFLSPTCPNVVLENFKRWWGTHGRTISEHEPESKLDQSQHALISLIGAKPAVWKGPVRVGPNQTWGIRSDSLSSGPKQTETEKTPRWSTHYRAERKHI